MKLLGEMMEKISKNTKHLTLILKRNHLGEDIENMK